MSDSQNFGFGKFVPGFDFLQGLAKGASQNIPQLPNLGNWIAPTLNVEELDKRIDELKTVQFWLDQNATALKATIQALEVQKMTLATLKGMNFNMGDVANAFKLKAADSVMGGVQKVADKAGDAAQSLSDMAAGKPAAKKPAAAKAAPQAGGVVDPMQWWGALSKQFQDIAANAMKDAARQTALDTTRNLATGVAKEAMKAATGLARGAARTAGNTLASGAKRSAPAKRAKPARKSSR
jgi:hypothetical protein